MSVAAEQPEEKLPQTHEELINGVIAEMLKPKDKTDSTKEIELFLEDLKIDVDKFTEMVPPLTLEQIEERQQFEKYMSAENVDALCEDFKDIVGDQFKPTFNYIKRKYHLNNQKRSSNNRKQKRIKITKRNKKIFIDYKNTLIKKSMQILGI